MGWIWIDDHYNEHPKFALAGPLIVPLWLAGLAYCNRNLTDGFIPWSIAHSLVKWDFVTEDGVVHTVATTSGVSGDDVTALTVITLLVDVGLWDPVRDGNNEEHRRILGYKIHDYADYQPLKRDVLKQRKQTTSRVLRWRQKRENGNGVVNGVSNGVGNTAPTPTPTPTIKTHTRVARAVCDDGFVAFWSVYPRHAARVAAAKAWTKLQPNDALRVRIMAALTLQAVEYRKREEDKIPHAATWLNGRRWEDEIPSNGSGPSGKPERVYPQL